MPSPTVPGYLIGMDEAGYGPNLGPLLLAVTCWETPVPPQECDLYRLLADAVSNVPEKNGERLHLADSKQVNAGKNGFLSLETTALALLACAGCAADSYQSLVHDLTDAPLCMRAERGDPTAKIEQPKANGITEGSQPSALSPQPSSPLAPHAPPWLEPDIPLPVRADREEVARAAERLDETLRLNRVRLTGIRAELVTEPRFNHLLEEAGSKSQLLSQVAFGLLRKVWSPDEERRTLFVGDKHGGRNRYDHLLAEVLDGRMLFRVKEGREVSIYRIASSELRFQMKGETHLPVAAASIVAKYVRELSMELFNAYWARHCPGIKPTRGYPQDAARFRREIEPARTRLNLDERILWRNR
jgi:hypothetical protein